MVNRNKIDSQGIQQRVIQDAYNAAPSNSRPNHQIKEPERRFKRTEGSNSPNTKRNSPNTLQEIEKIQEVAAKIALWKKQKK